MKLLISGQAQSTMHPSDAESRCKAASVQGNSYVTGHHTSWMSASDRKYSGLTQSSIGGFTQ